jgi:hypothetical protein
MSWDDLPDELERLARSLGQHRETADTSGFIYTQLGRFRGEWHGARSLSAVKSPLPLPRDQGLHPAGCILEAAFLSFHYTHTDESAFPERADFQVQIEGILYADNSITRLQDHWRVDTDQYAEQVTTSGIAGQAGASANSGSHRESHPLFHFQRGGHAQDAFASLPGFLPSKSAAISGDDWKALLQCPGPRLPALPMDPTLAIDFCIAQNDGVVWRHLRETPEYSELIEGSQARLWKPFFSGLASREFRRRWLGSILLV